MDLQVSHDTREETIESKARWFKSLSLEERMDYLCAITDFILEVNPKLIERIYAQPTSGRVRVLTAA